MEIDKDMKSFIKGMMDYSDDEVDVFLKDPRNLDIFGKYAALSTKTIIAEIIESHGCYIGYRTGDLLYFDGGGNLLTSKAPKRICPFAMNALTPGLFTVQELFFAGVDPNEMRFKTAGCPDVGLGCGGWGHVVFKLRVEDRG